MICHNKKHKCCCRSELFHRYSAGLWSGGYVGRFCPRREYPWCDTDAALAFRKVAYQGVRKKRVQRANSLNSFCGFAEGEGFKPPIPERGIPDFESSAIDHSANLPIKQSTSSLKSVAKIIHFSELNKFLLKFLISRLGD